MLRFLDWLLAEEEIPAGAIKVNLPGAHQETEYTCGPAIFRSVAELFGIDPDLSDKEWGKMMGATPDEGLSEDKIVKWAKKLGMRGEMKRGMSDEELRGYLDRHTPVICAIQAWGHRKDYKRGQSGHWVGAIGYTGKKVIFEDPSLSGEPRGFLTWAELDKRWHDRCNDGPCRRLGIALWNATVRPDRKGRVMKRIE